MNEVYRVLSDPQKRRLQRIAWAAVCLLWGGWFSLAVSAPDTVLGVIIVFAMAFGGFAWAAMDWSLGINKVLAKVGITTFSKRAAATVCLISFTILALNFVGSLAARSSTPQTELITNVSGTSVSSASGKCQPAVFSQQEFSALKQQAANGNPEAQCGLGMMYIKGQGVPRGYAQAALWFRKAAEQGLADAEDALGSLYGNGEGVPQDYAQAERWFRKSAEQGDADAQYNLGVWYEEGENRGVPQDDTQVAFWRRKIRAWRAYINSVDFHNSKHWRCTKAAFWYRKAAEQGDADAQYNLGRLYYDGRGVSQDYDQAALWFRAAAEQGDSDAQDELGDLYLSGEGVTKDCTQAAGWYRKAAEQGDADAQESLGDLYLDGKSVPRDYAEAYFWYDLAAAAKQDASDSKQVAKDRDDAASRLTPADLFRAQDRAAKWFETHQAKAQ